MNFKIKKTAGKEACVYRTLYIKNNLADQIESLAKENDASWNNVVISMIEACLEQPEPPDGA